MPVRCQAKLLQRITIGVFRAFILDQTLKAACSFCSVVDRDGDLTENEKKKHEADIISQLCDQYMDKHSRKNKKPGSI